MRSHTCYANHIGFSISTARRRSNVSHREWWTDYEIRLLGRIRDDALAKLVRRSVDAVAAKRESLDIPIFQAKRVGWSKREIELLGKRSDSIVARMLGRSRYAVQLKRYALRIPPRWEGRRRWTHCEEALLGTIRDREAAKKLGRSISSVRAQRLKKTKIQFIRTPKRWTAPSCACSDDSLTLLWLGAQGVF